MAAPGVVLEMAVEGVLDPYTLTHLQKLLNLESYARLDDLETREFGHRSLHPDGLPDPSLTLLRDEVDRWRIAVVAHRNRPDPEVVARVRLEATAALRRVGLRPHDGSEPPAVDNTPTTVPEQVALSVRLGHGLASAFPGAAYSTMVTALGLRREVPGTGGEAGWRFLRRDESGVELLQAYADDLDLRTVSVLADDDPDPLVLEGVRLQILAAARLADVPVRTVDPHPGRSGWRYQRLQELAWGPALLASAGDDPSAEQLLALGDGADQSLDALLSKLDALDSPWELKRGLVLTAIAGLVHDANSSAISGVYAILPRDGVIHDQLRDQLGDLLVGREPRPPLLPPAFGPTRHRPPFHPG